MKRKPTL
jgi:hypothetical protein